MLDLIGLSFGLVIRDGVTRPASNFGAPHADDGKLFADAPKYLGACAGGQKLFIDHLVEDGLDGKDRQCASDLQCGAQFDDRSFELIQSLVRGEHGRAFRVDSASSLSPTVESIRTHPSVEAVS